MANIVALVDGEPGNYGVSFPDLPGCVAAGNTLDEALTNASEVLSFHLEDMANEGLPIPAPRTLDALRADPEFELEFKQLHAVALVPFEPATKSLRINISIDERLLNAIDRAVEQSGSTRSGFLADAARSRLGLR